MNTDALRLACRVLESSPDPAIQNLAKALGDLNALMDDSLQDRQKLFQRVQELERRIEIIEKRR